MSEKPMTLGQQLREARERKEITLQKAAEDTKVKADILLDLEADDYTKMIAPVYTKGFLKIYCQYLGLDVQLVHDLFAKQDGEKRPAATIHKTATQLKLSPVDRLISSFATMWGMWLLVGGIVVALILIVWLVITTIQRASRETPAIGGVTTGTIQKVVKPPPPPRPAPPKSTSTIPVASTRSTSKPGQAAYIKPMQPPPAVLSTPDAAVGSDATGAALTFSVRLTEPCWIEVVADGRRFPYGTQQAGWENEWRAQKSIVVTVGNAGGVRATLNGKDLAPLGRKGQKVKRTFTR